MLCCPSPKSQAQDTIEPPSESTLSSSKVQLSEKQVMLNAATGPPGAGSVTVTVLVTVPSAPSSSVTVRLTWKSAPDAKVWLGFGFCELSSSPKSQADAATVPSVSLDRFAKVHARSVHSHVKFAVGAVLSGSSSGPLESPQAATRPSNSIPTIFPRVALILSCLVKGPMARRSARPEGHRRAIRPGGTLPPR